MEEEEERGDREAELVTRDSGDTGGLVTRARGASGLA